MTYFFTLLRSPMKIFSQFYQGYIICLLETRSIFKLYFILDYNFSGLFNESIQGCNRKSKEDQFSNFTSSMYETYPDSFHSLGSCITRDIYGDTVKVYRQEYGREGRKKGTMAERRKKTEETTLS